jgi:hypothetical protein
MVLTIGMAWYWESPACLARPGMSILRVEALTQPDHSYQGGKRPERWPLADVLIRQM